MDYYRAFTRRLDQTCLRPLEGRAVVEAFRAALAAGCAAFVTHAWYLPLLRGVAGASGDTALSVVIDFPFGLAPTEEKIRLIDAARAAGASELELVINRAAAAAEDYPAIEGELARLEEGSRGLVRKVILETAERSPASRELLARAVAGFGFEYVKTSTGFGSRGATVEDVRALREALNGTPCGVKASGGIRTLNQCVEMLQAGADRIGTSCAPEIIREAVEIGHEPWSPPG